MKIIIATLLCASFFIGCGESESGETPVTTPKAETSAQESTSNEESMIIDKEYTMYSGDNILKKEENTLVVLSKNSNATNSKAVLVQGKAVIVRK